MKIPKNLKKVNARVIQTLMMVVIMGFFVYVFYHSYHLFSRYQGMKAGEDTRPVERPPMKIPQLFNFSPDDESEDIERYQLFSFEKKKIGKRSLSWGSGNGGPGNYRILGVVKRGKLFLLVRFNSDDRIGIFAEGMEIDRGTRVEKLTFDQVIIADPSGQESTYKIFQKNYGYTTANTDAARFPHRVPVRREEADDEPRGPGKKQEGMVDDTGIPGEKDMRVEDDQPKDEKIEKMDEKMPKSKDKPYKKKDKGK
jgi:hypothetical protein